MNHQAIRVLYAVLTVLFGLGVVLGVSIWLKQTNREYHLVLTSGSQDGIYMPLALSIKEVVEAHNPKIKIEVIESAGSAQNLERLESADADLALTQNDMLGPESLRTLSPLHLDVLHFAVRTDSDIHSIQDLAGKKVAWGMEGSGSRPIVEHLFKHYAVSENDIELIPMSTTQACGALEASEIDAMLFMIGLHSKTLREFVAKRMVRFVSIGRGIGDGTEIEGFRLGYPFAVGYLIPRYAYAAASGDQFGVPPSAISALAVQNLLVCRQDLPNHIANQITKSIHQHRTVLLQRDPSAAQISEEFNSDELQFPVHPGAEQYYLRDEPGWMATYADLLGFVLSVIFAIGGFFAAARQWWVQSQKDRIDDYYLNLDRLIIQMEDESISVAELRKIDRKLNQLRTKAVHQLADEQLMPDESFRIFQDLLNHSVHRVEKLVDEKS